MRTLEQWEALARNCGPGLSPGQIIIVARQAQADELAGMQQANVWHALRVFRPAGQPCPCAVCASRVKTVEAPSLAARRFHVWFDEWELILPPDARETFRAVLAQQSADGVPCTAPDCDCAPGWCRERPAPKRTKGVTDGVRTVGVPSDEECDKAAAQAMDRVAAAKRLHALEINPDVTAHHTLRRELIRAGYALATSGVQEFDPCLEKPSKMQDAAKLRTAGVEGRAE